MSKKLLRGKSAFIPALAGIEKLNDAVKVTMGPKGNTVIIGKHAGNAPKITKDGVTVSENFELEDADENLAASIVKQAAAETAKHAGDGTSTATLLAHALIIEGVKAINKGANAMDVKRGIDEAIYLMVQHIKSLSKPVDLSTLRQISIISANNDEFIGGLIAKAFEMVGNDGVITIEESKTYDTTIEVVAGFQIDKGFISPEFVRGEAKKSLEFINPFVVLIGKSVSMMSSIIPIIEHIIKFANENKQTGRPILFVAENMKDEALATLVVNHIQKTLPCCVIGAPAFGPMRNDIMEDIALMTGATYILEEKGLKLEDATIDHVGTAAKIIVEENKTIIIQGAGDPESIKSHCLHLKELIDNEKDDRSKAFIKGRLARIKNGVAVIKVGGATDIEVMEKKDRIDDAVCAIHSANEEGFVAGGGTTYLHCSNILKGIVSNGDNVDQTIGIQIVRKALEAPFTQIMTNAGLLNESNGIRSRFRRRRIISQIQRSPYGVGVNMKTDKFEDLLKAGIIDPAKVSRVALENAASVAGIFLTMKAILNENKTK